MKRFSLVCCLILMLNMFCPAAYVYAEGITTPTDLPCGHWRYCNVQNACGACGAEYFGQNVKHGLSSPKSDDNGHWDVCLDCNQIISEVVEHNWEESGGRAPTCMEWGGTEYTCETCGHIRQDDYEPLGHSYEYTIERMMHIGICGVCGEEGERSQHYGMCTSPTVCYACGATEAEVEIAFVGHEYNIDTYEYNDTEHWITCQGCGTTNGMGSHWTNCENPNSCIECNATDVTLDIGHFNEFVIFDETTHQGQCVMCGELGEVGKHEEYCWDPDRCIICEQTGLTMSYTYHYTWDLLNDENEHWEYCDGCQSDISVREAHYDDCKNPDGKCDVCDAACGEEALTHSWKETGATEATCVEDGVKVYTCENCKGTKEEIADAATGIHTWTAKSKTDAVHYILCELCGKVSNEEEHSVVCDNASRCMVCGETNLVEPYIEHNEWKIIKSDANGHQYGCATCGKTSSVEDHYAWCNLTECEECGYSLTGLVYRVDHNPVSYPGEVVNDEYGHKHYCGYCGELWNETAHLVTCDAADLDHCQTCGMSSSEINLGIDHGRNQELMYDEDEHWTVCAQCGEEYDRTKHMVSCVSAVQDKCDFCGQAGVNCVSRHNSLQISHDTTTHLSTCKHCGEIFDCLVIESDSIQSSGGMSAAVIVKQPTHTEDGLKRGHCYACSNKIVEIPIKAQGHTWSKQSETPATCTAAGEIVYSCSGCDELKTETIPIKEHTMEWEWDAQYHQKVCSVCGYDNTDCFGHMTTCAKPNVCEICGAKDVFLYVNHNGEMKNDNLHHWTECEVCGEVVDKEKHTTYCDDPTTCEWCGAEDISDGDSVYHRYDYSSMEFDETSHWVVCSSCGDKMSGAHWTTSCDGTGCVECFYQGEATEVWHSGGNQRIEYDDQNHWEHCVVCGEDHHFEKHYEACETADSRCDWCLAPVSAEAALHIWGEPVTVTATCTTDGSMTTACTLCGEKLVETIKATGVHAWREPVIVEATCVADGSKTIACTLCGEETVETIKATGEHTWSEPVIVEATCAANGSKTTTCTICGEKKVETITTHDDHTWKTVADVAATCTKPGRVEKVCTVCDETSLRTYTAKGHNEVIDEAKESTVTENGLTEGKHCDVCGEVIVAQEVIPAVKKVTLPMTELEILVNHVTAESQHDNRGGNIPQNGKDFEIPLTKSDKTSKGVVLQVYRDDNETYNAVGLSTTFKKDVTVEIDTWSEEQSVEALQTNNQAIADFGDYFRSLIQVLNPECTAEESEALLLDVLKSISITDENIEEVMSTFINGELADDLRTVIKDGYEYLLVFDGETLSLSIRKIGD